MQKILVLGAGKSATILIRYLLDGAEKNDWMVTVGDASESLAKQKTGSHPRARAIAFHAEDTEKRNAEVAQTDIVISLMPPHQHPDIAACCVAMRKHFVSASFVSDSMRALHEAALAADVILLNECGLDPGLDHMSAVRLIDALHARGAEIHGFESYTGGLIAPENDNNPWHYKFTWNPRNVVLAGQGTAKFLWNGTYKYVPYHKLFSRYDILHIPGFGEFEGYPNRDSLLYREAYGLEGAETLVRGTLRRRGYCDAWNALVQLGLTEDSYVIEHLGELTWDALIRSFLPYDKRSTRELLARYLHLEDRPDIMAQLEWLGIFSDAETGLAEGTPAQALQKLLEVKWKLQKNDRDMCVMMHTCDYRLGGKPFRCQSSMVQIGENETLTAMAKTVGLPLAISAERILQGDIKLRGVVIPVHREIYEPVLQELALHGIHFTEEEFPER